MKELIHFTATWCQPCKAMAPVIDKFVADNPDIKYTKLDIDEVDSLLAVEQYDVRGVPTFVILKDDEVFARHTGAANPEKFASLFLDN
jgi:thioredoxin 1